MKRYPAIEFIARHGRRAAIGIGLLVGVVCLLWGGFQPSLPAVVTGVLAAVGSWALARVGVEVVEVVAETLLPR